MNGRDHRGPRGKRSSCDMEGFGERPTVRLVHSREGTRPKLLKALSKPQFGFVLVEHRERLARFGFEIVDAILRARGDGGGVLEEHEVDDDLVRDMTEVLTSFCARLYGRRSAKRRAERALEATRG